LPRQKVKWNARPRVCVVVVQAAHGVRAKGSWRHP